MKKKLLSLVLAGAMVATTSVSAFAAEDTKYEIQDGNGKDVEVKVDGNISAHDGTVLPGTVTVTVPTSTNFTVAPTGDLTSPTMSIRNSGDTPVLVIASEFVDASGTSEINVVKDESLLNDERKNVTLKITGGDKDIILTSESNGGKNGKMYKADGNDINSESDREIGKATKETPLDLHLTGKGVATKNTEGAIKDSFKLKLKIKQVKQTR